MAGRFPRTRGPKLSSCSVGRVLGRGSASETPPGHWLLFGGGHGPDYVRSITAVRTRMRGKLVLAWAGPYKGTRLIRGETWHPYQAVTLATRRRYQRT
jgi:hypothetical protein